MGKVAGVQVAHQVAQLGRGGSRERQAIHHVLTEHGVVVNCVRRREAISKTGEYLAGVQSSQVHRWQLRRGPTQTLVEDDLAQQAVETAERKVPVKSIVVGLQGEILREEWA